MSGLEGVAPEPDEGAQGAAEEVDRSSDPVARRAATAARAADDRQGTDTLVLDVGAVLAITDYFVITSASNTRLVRTLAEEVEARVKADGGPSPKRVEGLAEANWVLLDYGDLVVHVFLEEIRRFYALERLWSDVPRVDWQALAPGA